MNEGLYGGAVKDERFFGSLVVCKWENTVPNLFVQGKKPIVKSTSFRLPHQFNLVE